MNCPKCGGKLAEMEGETPEGIAYSYFRCGRCGEEIVDVKQLHAVAQKYRETKRYTVKISKWGESIAMRIPKELVKRYSLKQNDEVLLVPEKKAIKIIA